MFVLNVMSLHSSEDMDYKKANKKKKAEKTWAGFLQKRVPQVTDSNDKVYTGELHWSLK